LWLLIAGVGENISPERGIMDTKDKKILVIGEKREGSSLW